MCDDEIDDEIDKLFDWSEIMDEEEAEDINKIPIGSDIQMALVNECLMVSPYVRREVGIRTRFDVAMYIPKGMNFIADLPESTHCWHKFRRIYCKKKWDENKEQFAIPEDERKQRRQELEIKEKAEAEAKGKKFYSVWESVPSYRYKGKEYQWSDDFWKSDAKKEVAICEQANCEYWKDRQKMLNWKRNEHGFLDGLHLFEIKSDKDTHTLLNHQIPNMLAIADYVWLVLGENQKKPTWLPPYISVMRYKDGKFEIEHYNHIQITHPPMYRHVFADQNYIIENKEEYAFVRLMRTWQINSMFRFMFEGQMIIDMSKDIEGLLSFLRRADKKKNKEQMDKFQRKLFDYETPDDSGGDD